MDKDMFDDLIQSCKEAVDYQKGGKAMARSVIISMPDMDISTKYNMLIETDKAAITTIIDKILLSYR
ncbi:MAG: hypothetical protein FWG90_12220 [Oscillospiraceae bacterium]|nr:hypothetical protein [Oscillospiraceae bacterium]